MDISSFGAGVPKTLTPLSWSITGADIACLLASSVGENKKHLGLAHVKVLMSSFSLRQVVQRKESPP